MVYLLGTMVLNKSFVIWILSIYYDYKKMQFYAIFEIIIVIMHVKNLIFIWIVSIKVIYRWQRHIMPVGYGLCIMQFYSRHYNIRYTTQMHLHIYILLCVCTCISTECVDIFRNPKLSITTPYIMLVKRDRTY